MSREYRETRELLNAAGKLSVEPDRLSDVEQVVGALVEGLGALDRMAGIDHLDGLPHGDLASALQRMASSRTTVTILPRIRELEESFARGGIGSLVKRTGEDIQPEHAARTVEHAWLSRVLEDLEFEDRRISSFDWGYAFTPSGRVFRSGPPPPRLDPSARKASCRRGYYRDDERPSRRDRADQEGGCQEAAAPQRTPALRPRTPRPVDAPPLLDRVSHTRFRDDSRGTTAVRRCRLR